MKPVVFAIPTACLIPPMAQAAEMEVFKRKDHSEIKLGHPPSISLYDSPAV